MPHFHQNNILTEKQVNSHSFNLVFAAPHETSTLASQALFYFVKND